MEKLRFNKTSDLSHVTEPVMKSGLKTRPVLSFFTIQCGITLQFHCAGKFTWPALFSITNKNSHFPVGENSKWMNHHMKPTYTSGFFLFLASIVFSCVQVSVVQLQAHLSNENQVLRGMITSMPSLIGLVYLPLSCLLKHKKNLYCIEFFVSPPKCFYK